MYDEIFRQVREFITEKLNPDFIIVFGSYAKRTTHSESDIDIAFYREDKVFSSYELFMIPQRLADIIGMEVDLVDLKEASTVFAVQIFSTGEVIYSKTKTFEWNCT